MAMFTGSGNFAVSIVGAPLQPAANRLPITQIPAMYFEFKVHLSAFQPKYTSYSTPLRQTHLEKSQTGQAVRKLQA
jgi:hypothetical protein